MNLRESKRETGRQKTILAYHGTDRLDFIRFDITEVRPFNIGLHFGTRAAALSRIEYLRASGRGTRPACPQFRILTCELTLDNPFRIDDVFGHSYGFLLDALESELGRARTPAAPPGFDLVADCKLDGVDSTFKRT